jgi:hypothetical protein
MAGPKLLKGKSFGAISMTVVIFSLARALWKSFDVPLGSAVPLLESLKAKPPDG